jgi:hypothetical protein
MWLVVGVVEGEVAGVEVGVVPIIPPLPGRTVVPVVDWVPMPIPVEPVLMPP